MNENTPESKILDVECGKAGRGALRLFTNFGFSNYLNMVCGTGRLMVTVDQSRVGDFMPKTQTMQKHCIKFFWGSVLHKRIQVWVNPWIDR